MHGFISSGLSSERIILSPFTKEFRGEGHSYESLNFSGATFVADYLIILSEPIIEIARISDLIEKLHRRCFLQKKFRLKNFLEHVTKFGF